MIVYKIIEKKSGRYYNRNWSQRPEKLSFGSGHIFTHESYLETTLKRLNKLPGYEWEIEKYRLTKVEK